MHMSHSSLMPHIHHTCCGSGLQSLELARPWPTTHGTGTIFAGLGVQDLPSMHDAAAKQSSLVLLLRHNVQREKWLTLSYPSSNHQTNDTLPETLTVTNPHQPAPISSLIESTNGHATIFAELLRNQSMPGLKPVAGTQHPSA